METTGKIRLDKWLWFARVVKTRALAQQLASSGHVRVNGMRAEAAAKAVRIGDVLTIALPGRVRVLKVLDVAERRGPAADMVHIYEDITAV
ncbi:MAG: RNA-binding S4 domain-containing protein [Beijerinckiaceae bacterium]